MLGWRRKVVTDPGGEVAVVAAGVPRWRGAARALPMIGNAPISRLAPPPPPPLGAAGAAAGQVCGAGAERGCETVAQSRYAELRGVPIAAFGLAFSASLAVLLLLAAAAGSEARTAAALIAFVALLAALAVDLVLLGVQIFAIHAFCRLCLLTYAVNALALVLVRPLQRRLVVVRQALGAPAGPAAFAGWAVATVAILAAVLAGSMALRYRERLQSASILGLPTSMASAPLPGAAAPTAPAAAGTEAQRYQEEAR